MFKNAVICMSYIALCVNACLAQYSGGQGTQDDPYMISNKQDLLSLAERSDDYSSHFVLTADIDLESENFTKSLISSKSKYSFSGSIDGAGHCIRNLRIETDNYDSTGLFGYIGSEGTIRNLGLESIHVENEWVGATGGLCGSNNGTISNCYARGDVTGDSYVGGLCGKNDQTIQSCNAMGTVTGEELVGGVCGENDGDIEMCYSSCEVTGDSYVGGLCGGNGGPISSSYSMGNVSGTSYVGGFCGRNYRSISWCYSMGSVTGSSYAGGFCGRNYKVISYCYSIGLVRAEEYFGGFCGNNLETILECYWNTETSGQGHSDGGWGLTSEQMCHAANYYGWSNGYWKIEEGQNPPHLAWQGGDGTEIDTEYPDRTYEGLGTQDDPYRISTATDLVCLSRQVNDWHDHYFIITDDIDLSGVAFNHPVIAYGAIFTGYINGNGKTISHIMISADALSNVGFISQSSDAVINNLSLVDITVKGLNCVGGLCGYLKSGEINNCTTLGKVTGSEYVGGFCGKNDNATINRSSANTMTIGLNNVGGFCGADFSVLYQCFTYGKVEGEDYVGGLCGTSSSIKECFSVCEVIGDKYVGGLTGASRDSIYDSYARGDVTGDSYVGGLCAVNLGEIVRTYSSSDVKGNTVLGGLCALNDSCINYSYWCNAVGHSDGGWPLTLMQLRMAASFEGWSNGHWTVAENQGNPYLAWENKVGELINTSFPERTYSGQGTEDDPYRISSVTDLLSLTRQIYDWDGAYFLLTEDLDLSDVTLNQPILGSGGPFSGQFDGNGKTISHFSVFGGDCVGFIRRMNTGRISNLNLVDVLVYGNDYVGGLCGSAKNSDVDNCSVTGYVYGNEYIGGLCGKTQYSGISNCRVSGLVYGDNYIGGLSGESFSNDSSNLDYGICECTTEGKVIAKGDYVGGLCGKDRVILNRNYSSCDVSADNYVGGLCGFNEGRVSQCHSTGEVIAWGDCVGGLCGYSGFTIEKSYSTGPVTGKDYVGGLCGYSTFGGIYESYATGDVLGDLYVGGLFGYGCAIHFEIMNCYARGDVTGNMYVGGFCGSTYETTYCYSTGKVSGKSYVEGFCGDMFFMSPYSCYWDIQTSGIADPEYYTTLIGKTTEEMKTIQTFLAPYFRPGWDFVGETENGTDDIWRMGYGNDYPILSWQKDIPGDIAGTYGVELADFVAMSQAWGTDNPVLDLDQSRQVDVADLIILSTNWLAGIETLSE